MLRKRTGIIFLAAGLLIIGSCAGFMVRRDKLPQIEGSRYAGTQTCIQEKCHPKRMADIKDSAHKQLFEHDQPDKPACELCHGKGSLHLTATGNPDLILIYKNMAPGQASEVCLTCHATGATREWYKSAHYQHDVSCNECHLSHGSSDKQLLKAPDPAICFKCHAEVQQKFKLASTHQFKDQGFSCAKCHGPHEQRDTSGKQDIRVNACLTCHKKYAAEFKYPHEGVKENCLECHVAHGSEYPGLIKADIKTLCESCHTVGHRTLFISRSFNNAEKDLKAGRCVVCHKNVHGSNFPKLLDRKLQRMGPPSGFRPPVMGGGGIREKNLGMQPSQEEGW